MFFDIAVGLRREIAHNFPRRIFKKSLSKRASPRFWEPCGEALLAVFLRRFDLSNYPKEEKWLKTRELL